MSHPRYLMQRSGGDGKSMTAKMKNTKKPSSSSSEPPPPKKQQSTTTRSRRNTVGRSTTTITAAASSSAKRKRRTRTILAVESSSEEDDDEEGLFEVERIVDHRCVMLRSKENVDNISSLYLLLDHHIDERFFIHMVLFKCPSLSLSPQ